VLVDSQFWLSFTALAYLLHCHNRNASVREANSGSLSNISVSDTPAQSIHWCNKHTSVWVTNSGSLSNVSVSDTPVQSICQCLGDLFWLPSQRQHNQYTGTMKTPVSGWSILTLFSTLAQSVHQRNENTSVRVTYSGFLLNTGVYDTLAQSIHQHNENTSVRVTYSGPSQHQCR
jgi:hypothetical protein